MRTHARIWCALFVGLVSVGTAYAGRNTVVPTTTLQAEIDNNTSVPDYVSGFSNGNLGAGNVSKVPTRKLLYPGATTKIFAHLVPWFGGSDHIQVGYRSDDPNQIRRQVEDMISRSIDGMIINWYGQNKYNTATLLLMKEIELRNGAFQFSLMPDKEILKACLNTAGCDVTQKLINELNYVAGTYFPSPAYTRIGGRPLLTFFLTNDVNNAIDWARVRVSVAGDPLFVFQNASGFWHAESDGAFAWVIINPTNPADIRLSYLQNWYSVSLQYPSAVAIGAAYKGFNDSLAAWAPDPPRIMNQYCGQTWITTMAEAWKHYSAANQLEFMQLVTWNDYEEGTSIEPGIENCVTISGAVSGHILTWSITGAQSTLDHFEVFITLDGTNLMKLGYFSAGTRQLDLQPFAFAPNSYTVYVKAVGKPSLANKVSEPITYTVANELPVAALSVTPLTGVAPLTVTASTIGSSDNDGEIVASTIDFGDGIVVSGPVASHTYSTPGTYVVSATVTDNNSGSSTLIQTVTAEVARAVNIISPATGSTVSPSVRVSATATSPSPIWLVQIYMDGTKQTEVFANFIDVTITAAPGTHEIIVQAWDNSGAIFKSTTYVTVVNQPPVAVLAVTPLVGIAPVSVTASNTSSSDPDSSIVSRRVDFGDGTVVSAQSASHTYSVPGTYTVRATVTDAWGATATASQTVSVHGVKIFAPLDGASLGSPVRVAATASAPDRPITAMHVYVDGAKRYHVNASSLDVWLHIGKGTRHLVVQAWDSAGNVYKSTIMINVR